MTLNINYYYIIIYNTINTFFKICNMYIKLSYFITELNII